MYGLVPRLLGTPGSNPVLVVGGDIMDRVVGDLGDGVSLYSKGVGHDMDSWRS